MTLPKKEWWCGCPSETFKSEKQFLDHMKKEHKAWCNNVLPKLLKEYKHSSNNVRKKT